VIVIMADRLEWLSVWVAVYVAFVFPHAGPVQTIGYGLALGVVLLGTLHRRVRRTRAGITPGRRRLLSLGDPKGTAA
jgi:hypothetical protein